MTSKHVWSSRFHLQKLDLLFLLILVALKRKWETPHAHVTISWMVNGQELKKAERSEDANKRQKEELELSRRLGIIIRNAAERGALHVFRYTFALLLATM